MRCLFYIMTLFYFTQTNAVELHCRDIKTKSYILVAEATQHKNLSLTSLQAKSLEFKGEAFTSSTEGAKALDLKSSKDSLNFLLHSQDMFFQHFLNSSKTAGEYEGSLKAYKKKKLIDELKILCNTVQ